MKRLIVVMVMLLTAAALFAGGIENKTNFNVGWLMNMSKNTETQRPDAVFFNPAGTAFMKDGLYVDIGNQFVLKDYEHKVTVPPAGFGTYNADNVTYLYPNAEIVFKKDNWAVFGAFGVFAGGGLLEYTKGTYLTQGMLANYMNVGATLSDLTHSLDVYSVTFGEIFGGAYAFDVKDMKISVSAAIRFLQGSQSLEANLDKDPTGGMLTGIPGMLPPVTSKKLLNAESSANGIGGIFGVHFKPMEDLDIAVTYQTITKMEYEWSKADGSLAPMVAAMGIAKKGKFKNDLPAVLGAGVGYRIIEELYASVSFTYFFNKQADSTGAFGVDYDNSWEIGVGATYDYSDKISFSLGTAYSKQGFEKEKNSAFAPNLNSFAIGLGTSLKFVKDLTIDIAGFKPFYFGKEYETDLAGNPFKMDLEKKSMWLIGIGATYKIF
ncbi:MAG: outer membrane protein transport protein [Spirochaetaceae bacterium]|nr:outer membrane protein transport protein [Spirochaetaceae bacterium]